MAKDASRTLRTQKIKKKAVQGIKSTPSLMADETDQFPERELPKAKGRNL